MTKAIEVTATANGYYGRKLRTAGEVFSIEKASDFSSNWMKKGEDEGSSERFVATGGTDGVVGTTTTTGKRLSAKEKREREMAGISDNDDRTRDFASNPANDAPAPEPAEVDEGENVTVTGKVVN